MELKELYQEIILDHGKYPRNFGKCKNFTSDAKGHNPLCGDKVHIYAQLDKDKKILDLSFEGEGCAISLASASILTDILKGKNFSLASGIIDNFLDLIKKNKLLTLNSLDDSQKTTLMSLSGVKDFPMRVKCATMAWHTVSLILGKNDENKR
jgi:nitrogen fixation NifU-like protein